MRGFRRWSAEETDVGHGIALFREAQIRFLAGNLSSFRSRSEPRDRREPHREDQAPQNSENSKANRIETMKGPAESGQICSVGRRKIAKKIAKNKRCYANTLRPRSRMLLKVMKGG